jgi:hypothetical protein
MIGMVSARATGDEVDAAEADAEGQYEPVGDRRTFVFFRHRGFLRADRSVSTRERAAHLLSLKLDPGHMRV